MPQCILPSVFVEPVAVFCLQTTDSDLNSVLDRAAPERSTTMAGPSSHPDGLPSPPLQLHVLSKLLQIMFLQFPYN